MAHRIFSFAAASALGMMAPVLARRTLPLEQLAANNEGTILYFSAIGVIYAVLLAFVTIGAWEKFSDAEKVTVEEAAALSALYHVSGGLGADARDLVRGRLKAYARTVIQDELPAMAQGSSSASAHSALNNRYSVYIGFDPQTERDSIILTTSLDHLQRVTQQRYERLVLARGTIPRVLWVVLVLGGIVTVGFTIFAGAASLQLQSFMSGLLSGMIMMTLIVALSLSFPLTGSVKVQPDAFLSITDGSIER